MYKIGEFAKMTGLSIRSLRYYDELELLIPEEVDPYTNYRYYSDANLRQVETITRLKNAGFSLEEMKEHWENFNDEVFCKKKEQLYQKQAVIKEQIKKLDILRSQTIQGKICLTDQQRPKTKRKEEIYYERKTNSNQWSFEERENEENSIS